jgi:hypothetical protein
VSPVRLNVPRVGARLLAVSFAGILVGVAACTGKPQIQLSQAPPGSAPPPTVTVAVPTWRTVTHTVTATTTVVTATTVAVTPSETVTLPARPVATTTTAFDQAAVTANLQGIISEITALDAAPISGSSAAVRLDALSGRLATLEATTAPPGLDQPSWTGRVISLRLFADAASSEALAGSPQATARYAVIRSEIGVLLSMVNGALHTNLTLPPAPARTSR